MLEPLRDRSLQDVAEVLVDAEVASVDQADQADADGRALYFFVGAGGAAVAEVGAADGSGFDWIASHHYS